MQPSPLHPDSSADAAPLSAEAAAQLHSEILRLQRENRTLSIALAEMERVAQRDMLTPLFNRRYFLSALHQRIARMAKQQDRAALIYIDINGLKQINDKFGHSAGDLALIEIAARLSVMMRRGDVLARIGGDEFGIILDHVNLSEARAWVRRLKSAIEADPLDFEGQSITLGAALGVAAIDPAQSAEEIMGAADSDMYCAKRAA